MSCGCRHREVIKSGEANRTHGKSRTIEYRIWLDMRKRCNGKYRSEYRNYGGRGIRVCERWDDFELFLLDVGSRPSARHSLERENNDGDYEPGNVRWATRSEQNRNKRDSKFIEWRGERLTQADWADRTGLSQHVIYSRLKHGWSVADALGTPVGGQR